MFGLGGTPLVGLDVGASSVKLISGRRTKNGFEVDGFVSIPLPPRVVDERGISNMDALNGALHSTFEALGQKKLQVATSLRASAVQAKKVTIPKIPKKEIPDQVKWEAEQVFAQDVTSVLTDYILLGEGDQVPGAPAGTKGWELLLLAVRQDEARQLFDVIQGAGAQVSVMDLDPFVVSDFLDGLIEVPPQEFVGFIDVGASGTRVSVRHKGNTVFFRDFGTGGNAFTDSIAAALGVGFADAEALKIQDGSGIPQEALEALRSTLHAWRSDLQQCEDIFVSQSSDAVVSRWYMFGGGVYTPGLWDVLQGDRIGERISVIPAQDLIRTKSKKIDPSLLAAWSMRLVSAAGLATRQAK